MPYVTAPQDPQRHRRPYENNRPGREKGGRGWATEGHSLLRNARRFFDLHGTNRALLLYSAIYSAVIGLLNLLCFMHVTDASRPRRTASTSLMIYVTDPLGIDCLRGTTKTVKGCEAQCSMFIVSTHNSRGTYDTIVDSYVQKQIIRRSASAQFDPEG